MVKWLLYKKQTQKNFLIIGQNNVKGVKMAGTYNRCPYCNRLRKRYMVLGDKKVCGDCYEEMAIDTFLDQENEKDVKN